MSQPTGNDIIFKVPLTFNTTSMTQIDEATSDCKIICKNDEIVLSHRIFLSKISKTLSKFFLENQKSYSYDISTFATKKQFQTIINLLLKTELSINQNEVVPLIKISHQLGIDFISQLLIDYLIEILNGKNFLGFLDSFRLYNAVECSLRFVPFVADQLKRAAIRENHHELKFHDVQKLLEKDPPDPPKSEEILKSIPSTAFLINIIKNPLFRFIELRGEKIPYCQPLKFKQLQIQFTDYFVGDQEILPQEKLELKEIIGINPQDFPLLNQFKCKWIQNSTIREMMVEILKNRSTLIENAKKEIGNIQNDPFSKWIAFQWLSSINKSKPLPNGKISNVDLIKLISTMDGYVEPFDPLKYGFIFASPLKNIENFNPDWSICNCFNQKETPYICFRKIPSKQQESKPPLGFQTQFPNLLVSISSVEFNLDVKRENPGAISVDIKWLHPVPEKIQLQIPDDSGKNIKADDFQFENDKDEFKYFKKYAIPKKSDKFSIVVPSNDSKTNVLRIKKLKVFGKFNP